MKKFLILLVVVLVVLIGAGFYKNYIWSHLTDKRLADWVASENKNRSYPKQQMNSGIAIRT